MHTDSKKHDTPTDANNVLADVKLTVLRWYYRMFEKDRCYKATLQDRLRNRWDCVDCCDRYIGRDWWLRP